MPAPVGIIASSVQTGVAYDSFVADDTVGPLGVWDDPGTSHVQVWDTPFKQGLIFTANENVLVHGARWWRPGTADGVDPGNDIMLRLGPISGTATHAVNYTEPWDAGTPQWVTILFDEPVVMMAGQTRHIYVNPAEGGNSINVARNSGYFTTPTASLDGLITTYTNPSGRFALDTYASFEADNVMPTNVVDAWYWLDPLVTAYSGVAPPMSVRFSTDSARYTRSPAGLTGTDYTVCCWVQIVVDKGNESLFFGGDGGGAWSFLGVDGSRELTFVSYAGYWTDGPILDVGVWYFVALVFRSAGSDVVYWAEADDVALTSATTSVGGFTGPMTLYVPSNAPWNWFNGRLAQLKFWTAALTEAELLAEMASSELERTANVWAYYSFRYGPQTNDESGNSRSLTVEGVPSAEDGPPVDF